MAKQSLINEFTKNFLKLVSGNVIVLALPIFTAPINSRLFNPKDYGFLGVFLLVVGFFTALSTSGYCHGIIISKSKKDRANFFNLTLYSTVISVFLSLLCTFLLVRFEVFSIPKSNFIYFVSLHVLLQSSIVILQTLINKSGKYGLLTKGRIVASISAAGIQIFLGYAGFGFKGLVIAYVSSSLVTILFYVFAYRYELIKMFRLMSHRYSMTLMRLHIRFLKFSTPSEMINNLIHQVPIYLFTKFFNADQLGAYIFSERLLGMPFSVMSGAFTELFRKSASDELNTSGHCRNSFKSTLKTLLIIAVPVFSVIALGSPFLFEYVFGDKWILSGKIASALSILYFSRFVVSPLTYLFILKQKQKEDFVLHLLMPLWIIAVVYAANFFGFTQIIDMMIFYSCGVSMIYILYFYKSYKFSR
ncbi:MAG: oligosaccharide flippase family protein [Bacteroidota bacterium]|nr:oligosaccharide flippase family protein [Bacteroidota bacterium]